MNNSFTHLTRTYTLSTSAAPFLIAAICAYQSPLFIDEQFFLNAIICLFGILAMHMAVNLYDDISDIKALLKKGIALKDIRFSNKRKACAILNGSYSMKRAQGILFLLLLLAFVSGIYFVNLRGGVVIAAMVLTLLIGWFYPKSSKYGLSELTIGFAFGPLLVNSVYYVLTGYLSGTVFEVSFAIGIMTTILSITHSLMDFEDDNSKGKKTLPVILKNKNLTVNVISLLILSSYGILIAQNKGFLLETPIVFIPVVVSLPAAIKLILSLYDYINIKDTDFEPKWYYGRMENWKNIQKAGMDYFMFRFYLSRNVAAIFNIALAVICFLAFHDGIGHASYFRIQNFIF